MSTNSQDQIQQMIEGPPLMRFSPYTHIQVQTVLNLGAELVQLLDESFDGDTIDCRGFTRAYSLFWLWVLASFETARTLCRERSCLSERLAKEICFFKRRIIHLRAPFAKLQRAGVRRPILEEAAVNPLDTDGKDLNFRIGDENFWARELVADFARIASSVQARDVVRSIYGQVYFRES